MNLKTFNYLAYDTLTLVALCLLASCDNVNDVTDGCATVPSTYILLQAQIEAPTADSNDTRATTATDTDYATSTDRGNVYERSVDILRVMGSIPESVYARLSIRTKIHILF